MRTPPRGGTCDKLPSSLAVQSSVQEGIQQARGGPKSRGTTPPIRELPGFGKLRAHKGESCVES